MPNFELISMNMRMATDEDMHLPAYDHTKLSSINTCPTLGVLRHSMHLRMPNTKRAMALEAGSTSHEGFAAVRLYQYKTQQAKTEVQRANVAFHGLRLFGKDRYIRMVNVLSTGATDRTNIINFAVEAIESTDFYDDIEDNRRTMSNITESIISYVDAYDMERYPIWIRDESDPETDIGIEIAYNIVVDIEYYQGEAEKALEFNTKLVCRFTGKLDGLHWNRSKLLIIEEKTGARLDENWLSQWILSHQITGYCLAAGTFTGEPCNQALVSGMRIPIGKIPAEGIRKELVPRNQYMFERWANWFVTSVKTEQQWADDVLNAPMYTHSCNRYFSTCQFLPFCAALDAEEKLEIIEEMELDEWDVLND